MPTIVATQHGFNDKAQWHNKARQYGAEPCRINNKQHSLSKKNNALIPRSSTAILALK